MRRTAAAFVFCAVVAVAAVGRRPGPAATKTREWWTPRRGRPTSALCATSAALGVAEASVVLKPKDGEAIVVKSNVLGLYRTHVKSKPDDVTVSCEKSGYKQVSITRRTQAADAPSIETSCTLERL